MRPTLVLLAIGGVVISADADAAILANDALTQWTDATCAEAKAVQPPALKCYPTLAEAPKSALGPGGGVLLAKSGNTYFEADPTTGAVSALIGDGKRTFVKRVDLLVPLAEKRANRPRSLVAASLEKADSGLVITLHVTTFDASGALIDEANVSFDVATLAPAVGPRALRSFRVANAAAASTTLVYWGPSLD